MFFDKHFSNFVFDLLKMINSSRLENGGFCLVDFQQTVVQKNIFDFGCLISKLLKIL